MTGNPGMKRMNLSRMLFLAALSLFAGTASAHSGDHTATGFVGGLTHPLMGLDHVLAMVAVGLWAAQQGGRALWAVPAAFVGAMGLGAILAGAGWIMPQVESGIALSVLVLGLLIAARRHASVLAGMILVGIFALFHGTAHGLEMPQATSPALYAMGFVLATVALHGAGIASSLIGRHLMRVAGLGIAATGLALLLG